MVIPEGEEKQRLWKVLEKEVEDIYITSSVPQLLEIAYKEAGKTDLPQIIDPDRYMTALRRCIYRI